MKKFTKILILSTALVLGLTGCNKVNFTDSSQPSSAKLTEPVEPIERQDPIDTVVRPVLKSGSCSLSESLLSCLACDYAVTPTAPKLLGKAEKLAKIMAMSCPVPNKSYAKDYISPEPLEIQKRLYACTESVYPETPTSSAQLATLDSLLLETTPALREKMFSGLWYRPPYSDHFELYFGLSVAEAVYGFCIGQSGLTNELFTSEQAKAMQSEGGTDSWLRDSAAQSRWKSAQKIRQQLISCLNKPADAPKVVNPPVAATKKCDYQSFAGDYAQGGNMKILSLLASGYKVALETNKSCDQVASAPGLTEFSGEVKIVGYRCF